MTILFALLLPLLLVTSTWGQTIVSAPAVLWDDTDCRAQYPNATFLTECGNYVTGLKFLCSNPGASGDVNKCDNPGDWISSGGGSTAGGDALTTQPLSQFAATTSDQLAGVLTNESGDAGGFLRSHAPVLDTATFQGSLTIPSVITGTTTGWITRAGTPNVNALGVTSTNRVLLNASSSAGGSFDFISGGDTTSPILMSLSNAGALVLNPNTGASAPSVDLTRAGVTKLFAQQPGAAPTQDNDIRWDSTTHRLKSGANGATETLAWLSEIPPSLTTGIKGDITVNSATDWQITAGAIGTNDLANDAVTDAKVANNITVSNYQPLDTDLTTLAGLTIIGTGTDLRRSTGTFATNDYVKIDANGNLVTGGTGPGGSGVTTGPKGDINVVGADSDWQIIANAVTNLELADMPTARIKGRLLAGTGDPQDLTTTEVVGMLPTFTAFVNGLVPFSGGGTTNYLRADGGWAVPPGGTSATDVDSISAATSCVDNGTTDAYACAMAPAISAYATNTRYWVNAKTQNTGGATLALNGIGGGPKTIVKLVGGSKQALATGDVQAFQWMALAYDGTDMVLLNPTINLQNAYNLTDSNKNIDVNSSGIKFRNLTGTSQAFYWCGDLTCTAYIRRYYNAGTSTWISETAPATDYVTTLPTSKSFIVEQLDNDDILKITEAGVISAEPAGSVDFSAAASTKSCKQGTSLPGTCTGQNECFILTTATAASRYHLCTASNTWTAQGGTGSGTPGGSSGQMQYNNGTSFSGTSGATATATQVTLTSPILTTPSASSLTTTGPLVLQAVSGASANGWIGLTGGINALGMTTTRTILNAPNGAGGKFDFITGGNDVTSPILLSLSKDGVLTLDPANAAGLTPQVDFSLADSVKIFPSQAGAAPTVDNDIRWDPTAHRLKAGENGTTRTFAWTSEVGPIAITSADCTTATIPPYGTCYQTGATTTFFYCPTATVCDSTGEAIALPTGDAQDLQSAYSFSGAAPGITLGTAGFSLRSADDQASAFRVCGDDCTTKKAEWYWHNTNGFTFQLTPTANVTFEIGAGKAQIYNTNTSEFMRIDEATRTIQYGPLNLPYQPILWSPMNVDVDGTNCTAATSETVNTSEKLKNFACASGGKFTGQFILPYAYNTGTNMNFRLRFRTIGSTNVRAAYDISAWCAGNGDPIGGTYSTAATCDINGTGTSPNIVKECNVNFTPAGSCDKGDLVSWRAVVAGVNTAGAANGKILGGVITWPRQRDRE